mgnify:CR=1 FL=1
MTPALRWRHNTVRPDVTISLLAGSCHMYRYDIHDQTLVDERVAQFRDQMERYRAGRLGEEEFRPLRLQNGLYIQKHAPQYNIVHNPNITSNKPILRLREDLSQR